MLDCCFEVGNGPVPTLNDSVQAEHFLSLLFQQHRGLRLFSSGPRQQLQVLVFQEAWLRSEVADHLLQVDDLLVVVHGLGPEVLPYHHVAVDRLVLPLFVRVQLYLNEDLALSMCQLLRLVLYPALERVLLKCFDGAFELEDLRLQSKNLLVMCLHEFLLLALERPQRFNG